MAIEKTIETSSGIVCERAYGKITGVGGSKEKAIIELKFYKDINASIDKDPLSQNNYEFVPETSDDASNWIKQAYEHLKTLNEYLDAIDC